MIIVTAAALHLLFTKRMMGWQHGLCFLFLMAGKAKIGVSEIHHLGARNFVRLVTFIASHAVQDMHIGAPVHYGASLMAGQAHLRTLLRRKLGKTYYILSLALGLQMLASRPVTGLASPLHAFQLNGIQTVMDGLFKLLIYIVMARNAGIRADIESALYHRQFCPVFTSLQKTLAAENDESTQYTYK